MIRYLSIFEELYSKGDFKLIRTKRKKRLRSSDYNNGLSINIVYKVMKSGIFPQLFLRKL